MKSLSPLSVALVTVFGVLPFYAQAEQNTSTSKDDIVTQQLPTLVVTASRTAQPLSNAIGDITVIDREQLQQETSSSMADVLAKQPGVQMYDSGGPQSVTGLFMRGASTNQSLVLLNGIRINNVLDGSVPWYALNPLSFEQVDVVRGAASSLYGSNAMGGVVNLVTEVSPGQLIPFSHYLQVGAGSHDRFKVGAGVRGANGTFDYSLNANFDRSHGFNATNEDNTYSYHDDKDGYKQASINGTFGYTWADGQRISLTAFDAYSNGQFDNGIYDDTDPYMLSRQQVYSLSSQNQITPWWQSVLRFSYGYSQNRSVADYLSDNTVNQRTYTWQNNFTPDQNNIISLLLERVEESARSVGKSDWGDTTYYAKRQTNAVGLIYQGHFDRHHLQASIRNDYYTDYGSQTTGSLAYDFDITKVIRVGVAGNNAFTAPNFSLMYYPGYANPNLKPERSRNIEAHIDYHNERVDARITAFSTRYKDLITSTAATGYLPYNVDRAKIQGISIDAVHHWGNTTFSVGADYLSAKDSDTDKRLIRRAKYIYRAGLSHDFKPVTVGIDYRFIGSRYDDADNTQAKRLGGFGLVDLKASVDLGKGVSLNAYLNNVFDKDYNYAYGYNADGRNFFINLTWQQ